MNLFKELSSDLEQIVSETKKKKREIKLAQEIAKSCLIQVTIITDKKSNSVFSTRDEENILSPFKIGCQTKQIKVVLISINAFTKLIKSNTLSQSGLRIILQSIKEVYNLKDENLKIKILQVLLTLLSTSSKVTGDILADILSITLNLNLTKNPVIHQTSTASIRQICSIVFDRIKEHDKEEENNQKEKQTEIDLLSPIDHLPNFDLEKLKEFDRDSYFLFQDLCLLTLGEKPMWIQANKLNSLLGLELIENSILTNAETIKNKPWLIKLIKEKLFQLIVSYFPLDNKDSMVVRRIFRIILVLMEKYYQYLKLEMETFIINILKQIELQEPTIQTQIGVESCKFIILHTDLLNYIHKNHETKERKHVHLYSSIIIGIEKFIQKHFFQIPESQIRQINLKPLESKLPTLYNLNPNTETDTFNPIYSVTKAGEAMLACVTFLGKLSTSVKGNPQRKERLREMINTSWCSIIATLPLFLDHTQDEQQIQTIFSSYQMFIRVCTSLSILTPRDAFLNSLIQNCTPQRMLSWIRVSDSNSQLQNISNRRDDSSDDQKKPFSSTQNQIAQPQSQQQLRNQDMFFSHNTPLSPKNILATKTLLNIAQGLGKNLGKSWMSVLKCIEQLNDLLFAWENQEDYNSPMRSDAYIHDAAPQLELGGESGLAKNNAFQSNILEKSSLDSTEKNSEINPQFAELQILRISLRNFFRSTEYQHASSVENVVQSLIQLNQSSLILFSSRENHTRLIFQRVVFELQTLLQITLNNISRLPLIWDLIINHLLNVFHHKDDVLKDYVLKSLFQLVNFLIKKKDSLDEHLKDSKEKSKEKSKDSKDKSKDKSKDNSKEKSKEKSKDNSKDNSKDKSKDSKENVSKITQKQIIAVISQILSQTSPQTERRIFIYLDQLLQSLGHQLVDGWEVIIDEFFRISNQIYQEETENQNENLNQNQNQNQIEIENENENENENLGKNPVISDHNIPIYFDCIQTIFQDYLAVIPIYYFPSLARILYSFAKQKTDVNISFRSVEFMWTLADYISKVDSKILLSPETQQKLHNKKKQIKYIRNLTKNKINELNTQNNIWLFIFAILQSLTTDPRPEVRDSSLQTFFLALSSHGSHLDSSGWETATWQILFPMLASIKTENTIAKTQNKQIEQELGRNNVTGERVILLVHHSRNTIQKQWSGTLAVALRGTIHCFIDFVDVLSKIPSFQKAWKELIDFVEAAALDSNQDVCLTGITCFGDIFLGIKTLFQKYSKQNLDSQNLDSQNLDSQNLDSQNLDSQNLDSQKFRFTKIRFTKFSFTKI
ncbi:protein mon2 [Anaeramoeba ignava]|uniref:Protein mon2 n=1 Tax=Anaeramoeba ignava TaxID=1746090 RepID=A0A9Q0RAC6_ANAIG|nr:protein mon2 [Anaeramoeba ignava]